METVRSNVDAWLLDFTKTHVFSRKDFYENRDGGIRLTLKLTPFLAETIPLWTNKIEPVIQRVNAILLENGILERKDATQLLIYKKFIDLVYTLHRVIFNLGFKRRAIP